MSAAFKDIVLFHKDGADDPNRAMVIKVNSSTNADLVYYCPQRHAWFEVQGIDFGKKKGSYFVNSEN